MRWSSTSRSNRHKPMSHRQQHTSDSRKRTLVTTTSSSTPTFRSSTPSVCHHNPSDLPPKAYSVQALGHSGAFYSSVCDSANGRPSLKVFRKTDAVRLRQVEHVNAERFILARIRHPFIVDLYATFQDHLNIYMLLCYVPGGELFSHIRRAQ